MLHTSACVFLNKSAKRNFFRTNNSCSRSDTFFNIVGMSNLDIPDPKRSHDLARKKKRVSRNVLCLRDLRVQRYTKSIMAILNMRVWSIFAASFFTLRRLKSLINFCSQSHANIQEILTKNSDTNGGK